MEFNVVFAEQEKIVSHQKSRRKGDFALEKKKEDWHMLGSQEQNRKLIYHLQ